VLKNFWWIVLMDCLLRRLYLWRGVRAFGGSVVAVSVLEERGGGGERVIGGARGAARVHESDVSELFRAYYLDLVRLAARLVDTPAAAEDVVQDVFAAVQRRGKRLDDPVPYLRAAVVNRSRSVLRRRRVAALFGVTTADGEPAERAAVERAEQARVLAAVKLLPGRQREIVALRFYEDLTVPEVAHLLGISPGAVSSSAARAMTTLKNLLGDAR
jgi:RNA polymerase sigma factor (sigma-70 family)